MLFFGASQPLLLFLADCQTHTAHLLTTRNYSSSLAEDSSNLHLVQWWARLQFYDRTLPREWTLPFRGLSH